jgi:hypothetical protein
MTDKIKIILICLTACFLLSACGGGEASTATLSIHAGSEAILPETEVTFKSGETVLDILTRETRSRRIHLDFTGRGTLAYVRGMDNRYEFDEGPESGWIYLVNGIEVSTGSGNYKPDDGDVIRWEYITAR